MSSSAPTYSVSSLMVYETCPRQYYAAFVLREPPPVTPAMRAGTDIHRLIHEHYRQPRLFLPVLEPEQERLLATFRGSRFNRPPVATESSFEFCLENGKVRGRIDVVLPRPQGLEIVDFKSGTPRSRDDVENGLQLPLYALAAAKQYDCRPEDVAYTYYYLRADLAHSFEPTLAAATAIRDRVDGIITAIQAGRFEPLADCRCYVCRRAARPARASLPR